MDVMWKNIMWMNEIFLGKKLLCIFCIIYIFTIAITRIHFVICKVRRDYSNCVHETFVGHL